MSRKLYEESNISAIANAIREKNGTTNTYKTSEMASAIRALDTEGGGIVPSGTLSIESNGNYDVTNYASASVNVSTSGGSSIDFDVEQNNHLVSQMLEAIANGTVWTGTFVHEGADGIGISGKTAIIDTGLAKINGLMCYTEITENDYSVTTLATTEMAIMGFDENGALITSGIKTGVIENYVVSNGTVNRQSVLVGSSNNLGFAYTKETTVENGVLYVTPTFDKNTGYTPFWMGKTYSFIVW